MRRCGIGLESIRRLLDAPSTGDALALAKRRLERSKVELAVARRPAAARLNACRAVGGRAERAVFAVEDANPQVGRYLNRLSDLLFVLARAEAAGSERLWEPGRGAA